MNPQPKGEITESDTETFAFDLMDDPGYLVIQVQGHRLLLDTGSPFTFRLRGGPQDIEMLGGHVRPGKMPFPETYLEDGFKLLGLQVDALVGLDVIGRFSWEVDRATGTIRATTAPTEAEGIAWMPLDAQDGPPIVTLDDGARAILDSGAAVSYRVSGVPVGARPVASVTDWSLLWGTIQTPVWESTLRLGGMGFPVLYGQLPAEADSNLAWMQTGWIVGADLFRAFRVYLDFPHGRLGLKALG